MACVEDFQRERVYRWEDEYVLPHDQSVVAFGQAQAIVDYVWQEEGLQYAPRVIPLTPGATCGGRADRLEIDLPMQTRTVVILHEIAHSMTRTFDGLSALHGPLFVGMYMKLLRHAGFTLASLQASATFMEVQYDVFAQPVFLDSGV